MKCFNSEKKAKIHAQETVDKNAYQGNKRGSRWSGRLGFFLGKKQISAKVYLSFSVISPQEVALILFAKSLGTEIFVLKIEYMFSSKKIISIFLFPFQFRK